MWLVGEVSRRQVWLVGVGVVVRRYIDFPILLTVNVEIFDARKFRALWTGPIIFNFRAH